MRASRPSPGARKVQRPGHVSSSDFVHSESRKRTRSNPVHPARPRPLPTMIFLPPTANASSIVGGDAPAATSSLPSRGPPAASATSSFTLPVMSVSANPPGTATGRHSSRMAPSSGSSALPASAALGPACQPTTCAPSVVTESYTAQGDRGESPASRVLNIQPAASVVPEKVNGSDANPGDREKAKVNNTVVSLPK